MKTIAETLKKLGPRYILEWRMEYFLQEPSLIMKLIHLNPDLKLNVQCEKQIPFDQIEAMDVYAPRLLYDMHIEIREKVMEKWGDFGTSKP